MERFSQTPYYLKKKNISPQGELLHSLLISSVYQITVCIMKYEVTRKSVQGDKQFEIDNMCCKRAFSFFFISASLDLYLDDKEASKSRYIRKMFLFKSI